jgi:hypothetical protein
MKNESVGDRCPRKARTTWLLGAAVALVFGATRADAQTCPFDDGNSSLTREGLVLTRYALGLRGAPLVAGTDILSTDAPNVELTIACPSCGLDINGSGGFDVVDATIISRKIAGLTGTALTDGLALGSGTRNTPAAVNSFLLAGCGTTSGTVTSITVGAGLSGGTITTSGTIGIANSGVNTNHLADASVTLRKLFDGDTSQAGYLLSATGPVATGSLQWVPPPAVSCVDAPLVSATVTGGDQGCAVSTCASGYTVTGGGPAGGGTNTFSLFQYVNARSGNGWQVCYLVGGSASASVTFSVRARCCKVD